MGKTKIPNTRAIMALKRAKVPFEAALYRYTGGGGVAQEAAEGIGAPPDEVYKTLVFMCGRDAVVVIVDANHTVQVGKLAKAHGSPEKAVPAPRRDAERHTGYQVGGISPLGQRKTLPTYLDERARHFDQIWVNGGSHGVMIRVRVDDLIAMTTATLADVT